MGRHARQETKVASLVGKWSWQPASHSSLLLTLANNERIPLKGHMRMIFEIRDLRFASPATVSRAGILYISDDSGYQWESYIASWLDKLLRMESINNAKQKR
jgi:dynein heavy chain